MLRRYHLKYYEEYNLLVCEACQFLAFKDIPNNHLQRAHHARLTDAEKDAIRAQCFQVPSRYFSRGQTPMRPLRFLPVLNGFKCTECNTYSKKRQTIKTHCEGSHGDREKHETCLVQINKGSAIKYAFGVSAAIFDVDQHIAEEVVDEEQIDAIMRQIVYPGVTPETDNQRSFFYNSFRWHGGDDLNPNLSDLVMIPEIGEEYFESFGRITGIVQESLEAVSGTTIQTRINIGRVSGADKAFLVLTSEESRKSYSKLIQFFFCSCKIFLGVGVPTSDNFWWT